MIFMVWSDEEADRFKAFLDERKKPKKFQCESCGAQIDEPAGIKGLAPPYTQAILCKKCYGEKGPRLRIVSEIKET